MNRGGAVLCSAWLHLLSARLWNAQPERATWLMNAIWHSPTVAGQRRTSLRESGTGFAMRLKLYESTSLLPIRGKGNSGCDYKIVRFIVRRLWTGVNLKGKKRGIPIWFSATRALNLLLRDLRTSLQRVAALKALEPLSILPPAPAAPYSGGVLTPLHSDKFRQDAPRLF